MSLPMPTATTRWRCGQCGNLTRFDVVRTARVKEYLHFTLAGEPRVEESEVLTEVVERIRCRWCGSDQNIELVQRVDTDEAGAAGQDAGPA